MTEKELLHKRERKAKRRRERKKELEKDPAAQAKKILREIAAIEQGEKLLKELGKKAEKNDPST